MISKFNEIQELFREIDKHLKSKVEIYLIGGAVLLYQELKPATKDIDIILKNKKDFLTFQNALTKAGFNKKDTNIEYNHLNLTYILKRNDFQIDLFLKQVCSKFSLSEGIIKRAGKIISLDNLSVFNCSNEDILLFKTMTERQGDLEDSISLAKMGLNWVIIKDEILSQIKNSGKDIWATWIAERFNLLDERGINIPIKKEIDQLSEEYFQSLEK